MHSRRSSAGSCGFTFLRRSGNARAKDRSGRKERLPAGQNPVLGSAGLYPGSAKPLPRLPGPITSVPGNGENAVHEGVGREDLFRLRIARALRKSRRPLAGRGTRAPTIQTPFGRFLPAARNSAARPAIRRSSKARTSRSPRACVSRAISRARYTTGPPTRSADALPATRRPRERSKRPKDSPLTTNLSMNYARKKVGVLGGLGRSRHRRRRDGDRQRDRGPRASRLPTRRPPRSAKGLAGATAVDHNIAEYPGIQASRAPYAPSGAPGNIGASPFVRLSASARRRDSVAGPGRVARAKKRPAAAMGPETFASNRDDAQ